MLRIMVYKHTRGRCSINVNSVRLVASVTRFKSSAAPLIFCQMLRSGVLESPVTVVGSSISPFSLSVFASRVLKLFRT